MNKKKAFKILSSSSVLVGGLAGTTAAVVACGAIANYPLGTYFYTYQTDPSYSSGRVGTDLVIWLSYQLTQTQQEDRVKPALEKLFQDAGYTVKFVGDPTTTYSQAPKTLKKYLVNNEYGLLPDVVLNYPDMQAILETKGLAQDFNDVPGAKISDVIVPAMQFDINSVFTNKPGEYAVPFFKSTDALSFNVPAFAMMFADMAKGKGETDRLSVAANSPQQRLLRMILANQTLADPAVNNIYDPDATTSYSWKDITTAWNKKTATGGVWEQDYAELKKNYSFKGDGAAQLNAIDWTKDVFGAYDELKVLILAIKSAYNTMNGAKPFAVDTAANLIFSYQFDKAGHTLDNFFIKPDNAVSPPQLVYDFNPDTQSGAALISAMDFVGSLVNSGALFVQSVADSKVYSSTMIQKHLSFLSQTSTNSTNFVTTGNITAANGNTDRQFLNPGDAYYDLHPTKASADEKIRSIINQGPSLFVTKVHPAQSVKIATLIRDAYASNLFGAQYDTSGVDKGIFGPLGYLYSNKKSYEQGSRYISTLTQQASSSSNWYQMAGKYLLATYLNAQDPNANSFSNPAAENTSLVRSIINAQYSSYVSNGQAPSGVNALLQAMKSIVPDTRLTLRTQK